VNRQLLARRRAQPAPRSTAPPARSTAPAARAQVAAGPTRVLRRPLVLGLVGGASAALALLGWMLLNSPTDPSTDATASVLVRPRATAQPTATATASPGVADSGDMALGGRDPFAGDEASASPTTAAQAEPAPTAAPAAAPTPAGTATAARAPATVTVTVGPTYLGFYAWNGSRASFRVNARGYTLQVGSSFGPGLRFTAVVQGSPRCAKLQHLHETFTLCPGQVTTLT
jgi:hypothetical protein